MAWAGSGICASWFAAALGEPGSDVTLDHSPMVALFDGTVTPASDASPPAAYGDANWPLAAEQIDTGFGTWPPGGFAMNNWQAAAAGDTVAYTSSQLNSGGAATIADPHGDLLYDVLSAGRLAFCYHYWGGPAPIAGGLFRIIWHPDGAAVLSVTPIPAGGP